MEVNVKSNLDHVLPLLEEIKNLIKLNQKQNQISNSNEKFKLEEHAQIKGLYYCDNILSEEEENEIITKINEQFWLNDLIRRVQHYGYKYDYKKRKINKNDYLGELPNWTQNLEKKIFTLIQNKNINLSYNKFDQLIINEYKSNQGISAHIDCVPCFKDGIVTVTVGCPGIMTFRKDDLEFDVKLKRGSVAILTGDARYKWTHEINKTKNKNFTNINPRISLTFRNCIL
jgi:alkylated DNA repair dioxygenase AlkB